LFTFFFAEVVDFPAVLGVGCEPSVEQKIGQVRQFIQNDVGRSAEGKLSQDGV